jgi:hypothetical protein
MSVVKIIELKHLNNTRREAAGSEAEVRYFDHQPGDGTRYVMIAFDLKGKGLAMNGVMGYVGKDAVVAVCGMTGRAYLFHKGDMVSEFYISEKFGLTNEHSVHHYTELVAEAIGGVVICQHKTTEEE